MDLKLLATLKEKLRTAKEFSEVWGYFLDNFGENSEFLGCGEAIRSEFLEGVLAQVVGQIFKSKEVELLNMRLVRISEYHFVHGGCIANGTLANLLYFEDACQGVLYVGKSYKPGEVLFARFSGVPMPSSSPPPRPPAEPSVN